MTYFFIWTALALAGFVIFFIRLKHKHRHASGFRIRLNIILLLFALVPSLPALFFIAQLLTQSTRMLLMPGLDSALLLSLDTIRSQAETKGRDFFELYPDTAGWTGTRMAQNGIETLFTATLKSGRFSAGRHSDPDAEAVIRRWQPTPGLWRESAPDGSGSTMITHGDRSLMLVYRQAPDSTLLVAAYPVDPQVIRAKEEITRALRVYSALSLLKETVLEKNIIWALSFLIILILALSASGAARRIAAGISRPVQQLARGMARAAAGDLSVRIDTDARDEFRYLLERFNAMTSDLETGRKKLLEAERLAAWQQVARQISHEIKNSLTPVSLSLRRLYGYFSGREMPRTVKESLLTVEEELTSLERLADEFSRFARMPKPRMEQLDLNTTVRAAADFIGPSVAPVPLECDLGSRPLLLQGDREQLRRVLINLIKNAAEASVPGAAVTVSASAAPGAEPAVLLRVRDRGRGMDADTLSRIFDPYFTSKPRGTGLGLAIVKHIVQEHGASITAESAPGQGSVFTVRFPADNSPHRL